VSVNQRPQAIEGFKQTVLTGIVLIELIHGSVTDGAQRVVIFILIHIGHPVLPPDFEKPRTKDSQDVPDTEKIFEEGSSDKISRAVQVKNKKQNWIKKEGME